MLNLEIPQLMKKEIREYIKECDDIYLNPDNSYSNYQYDKIHSLDTGNKKGWRATYFKEDKGWL